MIQPCTTIPYCKSSRNFRLHQEQLLGDINAPAPLLLTGPAASVVLNVITGLFPPEEEPCNPFTVAIEIAVPTPAPANCVNVIAVPAAPPTVIESFVVKTQYQQE
jgi:hypothetical protein